MFYKYANGPIGPQTDEMRRALQEEVRAYQRWLHTTDERVGDIHLLLIETKDGCVFMPKLTREPYIADNEFVITPEMDAENAAIVLQTAVADVLLSEQEISDYKEVLADLVKQAGTDAATMRGDTSSPGQRHYITLSNLHAVLKAAFEIAQKL